MPAGGAVDENVSTERVWHRAVCEVKTRLE